MRRPVKRLSKQAIAARRKAAQTWGRRLDRKYASRMFALLATWEESGASKHAHILADAEAHLYRYGIVS